MRPEAVAAILLAAGRSIRFGRDDKLTAPYRGKPLFRHAAETIAALPFALKIAVVRSRDQAGAIHDALTSLGFTLLVNDAPEAGLAGSLTRAIGRVADSPAPGVLVCLGDMPEVTGDHLIRLCDTAQDSMSVVASTDGATPSPPAFIGRAHFAALLALRGDKGARDLLDRGISIAADRTLLRDVDRPADLRG
jgi:molybdenum cofactor cytidylyltransferase